ncbi:amidase [Lachancea thermotolerans CBS 6340]|uniref:KLTH0C02596p n=1 Tax=Lachancea thermotolerans (strain ATCC 56472 / CBS 6340 / NRRL Y-8284) TaxID=559295 RepID=C5DDP2_LACTC|nr:KLTH0C02596p [Lachancea thermotolerans CBS 6340]CAR21903.1 KLTH0C02596p [Lachancea thermotolerans CBS 6340]
MGLKRLTVNLRIAVVQLNPQIGHLEETVVRAHSLVRRVERYQPDIVVFPEFALSGYSFHSRAEISAHLCRPQEGPAWEFCQQISRKLSCVTVMGYPERGDNQQAYNSALVVDEEGKLAFNYRKSFLYDTDEEWQCAENPAGFQAFELPLKGKARDHDGHVHDVKLRSAIGICMDLSPYKFKAPFQECEFSTYQLEHGTELLIVPMAWLHASSVTRDTADPATGKAEIARTMDQLGLPLHGSQNQFQVNIKLRDGTCEEECPGNGTLTSAPSDAGVASSYSDLSRPDQQNLDYWTIRFMPFLACKWRENWFVEKALKPILAKFKGSRFTYLGSSLKAPWLFENKNALLVLCNRCGAEDGATVYAGSSGFLKFNGQYGNEEEILNSSNRSVELLGNLGKGYEGVIVRDVSFEIERDL